MSKRSTPYLRSCNEIKKDTQRNYEAMEKKLGKIHPAVLQKPYSACERKLRRKKNEINRC